jgi:hypothetical protein
MGQAAGAGAGGHCADDRRDGRGCDVIGLDDVRREATALCRAVMPDLAGRPVYVVWRHELDQTHAGNDDASGYTGTLLDLGLQADLERLGRWRGRGPAMVVDVRGLAREAHTVGDRARCRDWFTAAVRGVVLHELAHVAESIHLADVTVSDFDAGAERTQVVAAFRDPYPPASAPPWRGHGLRFVRALAHLHYRACELRLGCAPELAFDSAAYRLSMLHGCRARLRDELEGCHGATLVSILATEPPARFAELFRSDTAR